MQESSGKGDLVGCDISTSSTTEEVVVKSSSDVRALTYCDLEVLHIPGLTEVLRLHQEFLLQFSGDIQHDLTYNLREGYDPEVTQPAPNSKRNVTVNGESNLVLVVAYLITCPLHHPCHIENLWPK